jgi:hypothetical protein
VVRVAVAEVTGMVVARSGNYGVGAEDGHRRARWSTSGPGARGGPPRTGPGALDELHGIHDAAVAAGDHHVQALALDALAQFAP